MRAILESHGNDLAIDARDDQDVLARRALAGVTFHGGGVYHSSADNASFIVHTNAFRPWGYFTGIII